MSLATVFALVVILALAAVSTVYLSRVSARAGLRTPGSYALGFALGMVVVGWLVTGALNSAGFLAILGATLVAAVAQIAVALVWVRLRCGSFFPQATVPPSRPEPSRTATPVTPKPAAPKPGKRPDPDPAPKAPSASAPPPTTGAIFLSYRRGSSSDVTGRIYDRLVQHFGVASVFKDVDSIPLGVDFRKQLSNSVAQCRLLLAVVGSDWERKQPQQVKSQLHDPRDFIRIEIESALQRQIPVVPVLVQGASLPAENDLPPELAALAYHQAIAVRTDPDFHSDMGRLIKGIEQHLAELLARET